MNSPGAPSQQSPSTTRSRLCHHGVSAAAKCTWPTARNVRWTPHLRDRFRRPEHAQRDQPLKEGRPRTLVDVWKDKFQAYLGTAVHGFPNLFTMTGPNSGLGHNSQIFMIEAQAPLHRIHHPRGTPAEPHDRGHRQRPGPLQPVARRADGTPGVAEGWMPQLVSGPGHRAEHAALAGRDPAVLDLDSPDAPTGLPPRSPARSGNLTALWLSRSPTALVSSSYRGQVRLLNRSG